MSTDTDLDSLLEAAKRAARADTDRDLAHWHIVQKLHGRSEDAVFTTAVAWARDDDPLVRCLAADLLGQLGWQEKYPHKARTLPVMANLLRDPDDGVVSAALSALGHLGADEMLDQVVQHARSPCEDVRFGVVMALLGIEQSRAIETLIALSADSDTDVRDWATFGLGAQLDLDSPEIRDALVARLDDSDEDTRDEAIVGLAKRGDPRVRPVLLELIQRDVVGPLIAEAAVFLADPQLLEALEKLLPDSDVDEELLRETIDAVRREISVRAG